MSLYSETGGSHIYESFTEIKDHSFRSVVKFYETNYFQIQQLPVDEYVELLSEYLNALFELSQYRKYIMNCHELIELSIHYNIVAYRGEDILQNTLLKKAACHYHIYQTGEAWKITIELLKINPEQKSARMLYEKCLMRKNKSIVHITRSMAIILLMASAIIVSVEFLLIRPFYDAQVHITELTRNLLFGMGLLILICGETYNRGITWVKLNRLLKKIKTYRANKNHINSTF